MNGSISFVLVIAISIYWKYCKLINVDLLKNVALILKVIF